MSMCPCSVCVCVRESSFFVYVSVFLFDSLTVHVSTECGRVFSPFYFLISVVFLAGVATDLLLSSSPVPVASQGFL